MTAVVAEMKENPLRIRRDAVAWREIDDEVIALSLDSSTYFGLNPTATALWRRLVEGATRDQLVADLVERFEVEAGRAATDVDAFVADLRERGLLEA